MVRNSALKFLLVCQLDEDISDTEDWRIATLLVKQYFASLRTRYHNRERLFLLACWFLWMIGRQSEIWECLNDADNATRGFHKREILYKNDC